VFIKEDVYAPTDPDTLLKVIKAVDEGNVPPPGNCTMIPADLLLRPGTVPILLIRDPRVVIPSAVQVLGKMNVPHAGGRTNFIEVTSHVWTRLIYDFFISHGVQPLVVDADDIMTGQDFVRNLCTRAGLDPAQAVFEWSVVSPAEKEKIHPMQWASQSTLYESSGLRPELAAKNRDLDAEMKRWEDDFPGDAETMREMLELATPNYQYLYEKRLRMPAA
jgi:hypothetical protein